MVSISSWGVNKLMKKDCKEASQINQSIRPQVFQLMEKDKMLFVNDAAELTRRFSCLGN